MGRAILFLLCAWAAPSQVVIRAFHSNPQPSPTGKGVIEGTVIDSSTHEPLKKAQVSLNGPVQPALMAVTDASGRFVFRQLPPGGYYIQAAKQGYNPPHSEAGAPDNAQVTLGADEEKKGMEILLVADGVISGRIVDEDGMPIDGCQVSAVERSHQQGQIELRSIGTGTTGEKGEYRMFEVPSGRYYLFARCQTEVPAPHPLLPRGDPRIPFETYLPKFYGGGLDPTTATRVTLAAGAHLDNIDFQVRRAPGFTLHGTLTAADPLALDGSLSLNLFPMNHQLRDLWQLHARHAPQSSTFQFHGVIPGSYLLVAVNMRGEHVFYAQQNVEIGAAPPEPLEIALSPGVELKGAVQFDSEEHPALEHSQIWMMPVQQSTRYYRPQPRSEIQPDGSFTLTGVLPGHWRLMINASGFTCYVKSLSLGGQPVSPYGFQTGPGAGGPMRVMLGTKMADVEVTVNGAARDHPAWLLIFPDDLDQLGMGLERASQASGDQVSLPGMPPGRYRLLATDAPNPWPILQRSDQLKALESHTQALEIPEGGKVNATVEVISSEDLARALADKES